MKSKNIFIFLFVLMIIISCKSANTDYDKKEKTEATNLNWNFQTLPDGWENNVFIKCDNVDYKNGMSICSSKQQIKICPRQASPVAESIFSYGFLQSIGSGEVFKITEVKGPVSIKINYTGAGKDKDRYVIVKINNQEVAIGEKSLDTLTEKTLIANYFLTEECEVTILSNNGIRFYDVIIEPIQSINPTKILFDKTMINLKVNEKEYIEAKLLPIEANNKNLIWKFKNNIAKEDNNLNCVASNIENLKPTDSNLEILALRPGEAILQCMLQNDSSIIAECVINVSEEKTDDDFVSEAESINIIGNSIEVYNKIKLSDRPIGWANTAGSPKNYGGYDTEVSNIKIFDNVDTYDKLKNALKTSGTKRVIYVTGSIDLNNKKTPYDYIKECGYEKDFLSYEDYKEKFGETCVKDKQSSMHSIQQKLFNAQKKQVSLSIPSNTTIIGVTENAEILNGELLINGKENIVIRNLKIWNAEDYFPLWYQSGENNYNSVYDNITIDSSKWIWIDHCTLGEDKYTYDKVDTPVGKLDWVTYDGAIDVGRSSQYVTISWCKFFNHDKTLLIGYGSEYTGDEKKLQVTVHHNYFENCKSRLPLVRYGIVHVYKNTYYCDDRNNSGFCIGVGYKSKIYAEQNVFNNCKYGIRIENKNLSESEQGKIFYDENIDNSTYWDVTKKAQCEDIAWNPLNSYIYSHK